MNKSDVKGRDICFYERNFGIVYKYGSTINANSEIVIDNNLGLKKGQNDFKFFVLWENPKNIMFLNPLS